MRQQIAYDKVTGKNVFYKKTKYGNYNIWNRYDIFNDIREERKLIFYPPKSLCFRCEYRAQYLEEKTLMREANAPRFECSMPNNSVNSCYMFKPVEPVVLERSECENELFGKERPLGFSMIAPRMSVSQHQTQNITFAKKLSEDRYLFYSMENLSRWQILRNAFLDFLRHKILQFHFRKAYFVFKFRKLKWE